MIVEKYYNEDKTCIAVLVSRGWGAGWSTWNNKEMAYDKRIIEAFLENINSHEIEELCKEWGYDSCYAGGWSDVRLEWVSVDEKYYIYEYDGAETLVREKDMEIA